MAPLARRMLWRLREVALGPAENALVLAQVALGPAAFVETFAQVALGTAGNASVLARYCTWCLYATVHDACTLLCAESLSV